jgi:hypothetical protein
MPRVTDGSPLERTWTPAEIAARHGVSADKVRDWIARGELLALNLADRIDGCKARWRVTREALEAFERARSTKSMQKPTTRRRRRQPNPNVFQFF